MNEWLMAFWYSHKKKWNALIPFSWIYQLMMKGRRELYLWKIKKIVHLEVPVIVVGNLTVGGTGKTPLTIELAKCLMQEGYKVGVVSRGYKGNYPEDFQRVFSESSPEVVGDEAVLLARNLSCPVVVSRRRGRGALYLQNELKCNVILSDDGLQHYALARDIEIAVIDGQRKWGNGFCLPAGPLREPIERLQEVDFCMINTENFSSPLEFSFPAKHPPYNMRLVHKNWVNLRNPSLVFNKDKATKFHAVTAIGHPDRFFAQLSQIGIQFTPHVFPDHYLFRQEDFNFSDRGDILMTEKDAVKCLDFSNEHYWYLPIEAALPPEFRRLFISKVGGIVKNR